MPPLPAKAASRARPFTSKAPCRRSLTAARGRAPFRPRASSQGTTSLTEAKQKYEAGDKLSAMTLYEKALEESQEPQERLAALYGLTVVHASFGDIELAQMALRQAVQEGLDFERALQDPENVPLSASPQMEIQLKRFSNTVKTAMAAKQYRPPPTNMRPKFVRGQTAAARAQPGLYARDLDQFLGTPNSDRPAIDASPLAVVRRLLLLILVGVVGGSALFFVGLEYFFPK